KNLGFEITNFDFGTDGKGENNLLVDNSVFKNFKDKSWISDPENKGLKSGKMVMKGEAIFRFTLKNIPQHITKIIKKNSIQFDDVNLFIFHQPSKIILKS